MTYTENFKSNFTKAYAIDYCNHLFQMSGGDYNYPCDKMAASEYVDRMTTRKFDDKTIDQMLNENKIYWLNKTVVEFKEGIDNPSFWGHKEHKAPSFQGWTERLIK